jgi:hypothetical protein
MALSERAKLKHQVANKVLPATREAEVLTALNHPGDAEGVSMTPARPKAVAEMSATMSGAHDSAGSRAA